MTMQADELKSFRTAAGFSQADLGEAIGMSRESIGAMERGQAGIELRTELAVRYVFEKAVHAKGVRALSDLYPPPPSAHSRIVEALADGLPSPSSVVAKALMGQRTEADELHRAVGEALLKDENFVRRLGRRLREVG